MTTTARAGVCTSLDHVYPVTKFGRRCYCGARVWGGRPGPKVTTQAAENAAPTAVASQTAVLDEGLLNPAAMDAALDAVEKSYGGPQKGVDSTPAAGVISDNMKGATLAPTAAIQPAARKDTIVQLQLKGLSKNGKQAIYSGAKQSVRFAVASFVGGTAPQTIDLPDGVFEAAPQPKAAMTPEEKAAAAAAKKAERAAKPKPTLAERVAAAEARLQKQKDKLAAEAAAANQPQL